MIKEVCDNCITLQLPVVQSSTLAFWTFAGLLVISFVLLYLHHWGIKLHRAYGVSKRLPSPPAPPKHERNYKELNKLIDKINKDLK